MLYKIISLPAFCSSHPERKTITSLPVAAGAIQILEGKMNQAGVNAPECLNAKEFIEYLTEIDYITEKSNYRVERKIGDEVVVGTILDKDKFPELNGN